MRGKKTDPLTRRAIECLFLKGGFSKPELVELFGLPSRTVYLLTKQAEERERLRREEEEERRRRDLDAAAAMLREQNRMRDLRRIPGYTPSGFGPNTRFRSG